MKALHTLECILSLQMRPISEEEMLQMQEWYNRTQQLPDASLKLETLPEEVEVRLGKNFTFSDFVEVSKI